MCVSSESKFLTWGYEWKLVPCRHCVSSLEHLCICQCAVSKAENINNSLMQLNIIICQQNRYWEYDNSIAPNTWHLHIS